MKRQSFDTKSGGLGKNDEDFLSPGSILNAPFFGLAFPEQLSGRDCFGQEVKGAC